MWLEVGDSVFPEAETNKVGSASRRARDRVGRGPVPMPFPPQARQCEHIHMLSRLKHAGQSCAFKEVGCWAERVDGAGQAAWYCGLAVGRVAWASGPGSCSEFLFLLLGLLVWPVLNEPLSAGLGRRRFHHWPHLLTPAQPARAPA